MKICCVEGCDRVHIAKGYCTKHYQQMQKHGQIFENTTKDFNVLVDKGDHYEIILTDYVYNETGRAKFDKEDLDKIKSVGRWSYNPEGYVENSNYKIRMSRFIMGLEKGDKREVDHIKTGIKSRSDNRKKNLRIATRTENVTNRSLHKNNTSGYKGVHSSGKKWVAAVRANNIRHHLGSFNTPEEAYKAYTKAAKKLHKEFYNKG